MRSQVRQEDVWKGQKDSGKDLSPIAAKPFKVSALEYSSPTIALPRLRVHFASTDLGLSVSRRASVTLKIRR